MQLGFTTRVHAVRTAAGIAGLMLAIGLGVPGAAASDTMELRLAHALNPAHSWHIAAVGFADQVRAETDGRIDITVFPGGQLGSAREMIEGLQAGTMDATVVGTGDLAAIEPRFGIVEMPYAWADREQIYAALDGELGDTLNALLEPKGFANLAWWESGFRHITTNDRTITTPADLAGLKIRVPPDRTRLDTFSALGAEPAPLSFGELYAALQQGVFDAQENPFSIILTSSFYEVQNKLALSGHVWAGTNVLFSTRVLDRLSPEDRQILAGAAADWAGKQRAIIQDSEAADLAALEERGMQVNEVDRAAFMDAVKPVWDAYEGSFGPELMAMWRAATGATAR